MAQPPSPSPPPWTLTEPQIRAIVERVRAGRDLTPKAWPNGARVAVGLSFDFDNETGGAARQQYQSRAALAGRIRGPGRAAPRSGSLGTAERARFVLRAGRERLLSPDSIRAMVQGGKHEIGLHGWIHGATQHSTRPLNASSSPVHATPSRRSAGGGRSACGTPSWDYSPFTIKIAKEMGLLYDSSLMADDRPYEVLAEGKPTGVVQLPVEWILDDAPYFSMDRYSAVRPTMTPDEVFSIWQAEFDGAYNEHGLFILTMHPHVIGHRSRIAMLDRLITHMKSKPGVWFATHEHIARYVKEQKGSQ